MRHTDGNPEEERVREGLRMVLVGEKGKEMRESAEKLKEMAANAVKQRGSSAADLTAFVSHINRLNKRPTEDYREVDKKSNECKQCIGEISRSRQGYLLCV